MELILTSFGTTHYQQRDFKESQIFDRMPPISMSSSTNQYFRPDYAVLLLCERIVFDAVSFERLSKGKYHPVYREVASVLKALYDEGFVRIEDFDSIVQKNHKFLELLIERDLKRLYDWIKPLKESVNIWQKFVIDSSKIEEEEIKDFLKSEEDFSYDKSVEDDYLMPGDFFLGRPGIHGYVSFVNESIKNVKKSRNNLRSVIKQYLSYVNANLVISNTLETGFHDWYDFWPFYRDKFLMIGKKETPEQKRIKKLKQLFEVSFPEFAHWNHKNIIKALKDRRISELRSLVDKAVKEEIKFDHEFANRVLQEVLGIEQRLSRFRKIVSYITLPIDFIPSVGTVVQRGVEELITYVVDRKARNRFKWFYFISELSQSYGRQKQIKYTKKGDGV